MFAMLLGALAIILLHFIGDFVFQTNWQAQNKSTNNIALARHVFIYSLPFWFCLGWQFALITAVFHFITDYNTSRLNKILWEKQDVHLFFVGIGFDQVLHMFQLLITFYVLYADAFTASARYAL